MTAARKEETANFKLELAEYKERFVSAEKKTVLTYLPKPDIMEQSKRQIYRYIYI